MADWDGRERRRNPQVRALVDAIKQLDRERRRNRKVRERTAIAVGEARAAIRRARQERAERVDRPG